jgi:hypothetical protein
MTMTRRSAFRRVGQLPAAEVFMLVIFVVLALRIGAEIPAFEASDEAAHFIYAHRLAAERALPVIPTRDELAEAAAAGDSVQAWSIEAHQPPLYYALGALLIAPVTERSALPDLLRPNPLVFTWGQRAGNHAQWLHPPEPDSDVLRAVWILRGFSLLLGCLTLLVIRQAVWLASQSVRVAQTAMLFAACLPMFVVVSVSVTNDALANLIGALGLWWALHVLRNGVSRGDRLRGGLLIAAAALAKITSLTIVGVMGLGLVLAWRAGRVTRRDFVRVLIVMGVITAALAGWWYLRNVSLYGDPLASAATATLWGRAFAAAEESGGWAEVTRIFRSFWLMVGHLHQPVWASIGFYASAAAITLAALAGLWRGTRGISREVLLVLFTAVALPVGLLIYGTLSVDISYGRLVFPGLAAIACLMALGWHGLLRKFAPLLVLPLALGAITLPTLVNQAYPPLGTVDALPADAIAVGTRAGGMTLEGYRLDTSTVAPGDLARFTLYFSGADARNPALVLAWESNLAGGRRVVYPGLAAPDQLALGRIYAAQVVLPVEPDSVFAPRLLRLELGYQVFEEARPLPWIGTDDVGLAALLLDGPVLVDPRHAIPEAQVAMSAQFGDMIRLAGYTLSGTELQSGQPFTVILHWETLRAGFADLQMTVQLLDSGGGLVTQSDGGLPNYPPRAWQAGVRATAERVLDIPAGLPEGAYTLAVGWYRLEDFSRLAVADSPDGLLRFAEMRR